MLEAKFKYKYYIHDNSQIENSIQTGSVLNNLSSPLPQLVKITMKSFNHFANPEIQRLADVMVPLRLFPMASNVSKAK